MNQFKGSSFIIYCFLSLLIVSCNDKWQEINEVDASFKTTLAERIATEPQLSIFSGLLSKSRYAAVLSSSLNFTVWAPSNEALASMDVAIAADSARLNAFIGNHITYSSYSTKTAVPFLLQIQ